MMTGSILKYRAKPEQTPAMILSSALLVKRLAIIKLPSTTLQVFVRLNERFLSYSTIIFPKIIFESSSSSSKFPILSSLEKSFWIRPSIKGESGPTKRKLRETAITKFVPQAPNNVPLTRMHPNILPVLMLIFQKTKDQFFYQGAY